jgi:hypothetical protein
MVVLENVVCVPSEVVSLSEAMSDALILPFSNTSNWYVVPAAGGGTNT